MISCSYFSKNKCKREKKDNNNIRYNNKKETVIVHNLDNFLKNKKKCDADQDVHPQSFILKQLYVLLRGNERCWFSLSSCLCVCICIYIYEGCKNNASE